MRRIILFRFHRDPDVCIDHINLLKKYNKKNDKKHNAKSNTPVYGLYGGSKKDEVAMCTKIAPFVESIYSIADKPKLWKWMHGDLAVRDWYRRTGKNIEFDMLHLVEWDLVFFASLEKLYGHIPKNGIGLTGLQPVEKIENSWDWINYPQGRKKWLAMCRNVQKKFKFSGTHYACLGPGYCLPKEFLEKYSKITPMQTCHDELRVPLYAQALGFKVYDTKFKENWFSSDEKYFNCSNKDISWSTLRKERKNRKGRRAFHPVRYAIGDL